MHDLLHKLYRPASILPRIKNIYGVKMKLEKFRGYEM